VVQLSIDDTRDAATHYEIASHLAPLRDEGVLILGSGNIVHNLNSYAWGDDSAKPYDWALRFDNRARELMTQANFRPLVDYASLGCDALLSAPTPEHYLPLLYVIAQRQPDEPVSFPVAGFDGGSISMLSVRIG
jgi:4,5-DOPA dioxygenase extradiol